MKIGAPQNTAFAFIPLFTMCLPIYKPEMKNKNLLQMLSCGL